MSAAESLNDYLAPDDDEPRREHWVVDDPARAEWALRKLAKLRRQMAENQAVAEDEKHRIDEWLADTNGKLESEALFFQSLLVNYHRSLLEEEPDRKTVSLPAGELKARKQPDRWTFTDDFTAWAQAHRPQLVRVKVEVDRNAAKKELATVGEAVVDTSSGEKVPGVTVEPGLVAFTVHTTAP